MDGPGPGPPRCKALTEYLLADRGWTSAYLWPKTVLAATGEAVDEAAQKCIACFNAQRAGTTAPHVDNSLLCPTRMNEWGVVRLRREATYLLTQNQAIGTWQITVGKREASPKRSLGKRQQWHIVCCTFVARCSISFVPRPPWTVSDCAERRWHRRVCSSVLCHGSATLHRGYRSSEWKSSFVVPDEAFRESLGGHEKQLRRCCLGVSGQRLLRRQSALELLLHLPRRKGDRVVVTVPLLRPGRCRILIHHPSTEDPRIKQCLRSCRRRN